MMGRKNRRKEPPGLEEFPPLKSSGTKNKGQAGTSSQPDDDVEFNEFDVNNEVSDNEGMDEDEELSPEELQTEEYAAATRQEMAKEAERTQLEHDTIKVLYDEQKIQIWSKQRQIDTLRKKVEELTNDAENAKKERVKDIDAYRYVLNLCEEREKEIAELKQAVAKLAEAAKKTAEVDSDEALRRYNEQKKRTEEKQAEIEELKRTVERLAEDAKVDKEMETDEAQGPPEKTSRPKKRLKIDQSSDSSADEEEMPKKQPKKARPATAPQLEEAKKPTEKIPPVVLRKQAEWTTVKNTMKEKKISFEKARLIADGVAIIPASPNDYRELTKTLVENKHEYHTYSLKEDRQQRVVIRGIPKDITEKEIKEDLERQGYAPIAVHRMTCRRTKTPMPLVLVRASPEDKEILEVNRCCSLVVRTEAQRTQQTASQCHRCQRFGHGQARCTAQPKCVKCGQDHASTECAKKREEPAKCANCQGAHPASYKGCPSFPKKTKKRTGARPEKFTHPRPARTFAEAARRSAAPTEATTSRSDASKPSMQDLIIHILETIEGWKKTLPAMLAELSKDNAQAQPDEENTQERQ